MRRYLIGEGVDGEGRGSLLRIEWKDKYWKIFCEWNFLIKVDWLFRTFAHTSAPLSLLFLRLHYPFILSTEDVMNRSYNSSEHSFPKSANKTPFFISINQTNMMEWKQCIVFQDIISSIISFFLFFLFRFQIKTKTEKSFFKTQFHWVCFSPSEKTV